MDLHENPENYVVTATFELPGLKKEDVQIEGRCGKFSRTLQLPPGGGQESDILKASLDIGVLTINFLKTSAEQAPKKFNIN